MQREHLPASFVCVKAGVVLSAMRLIAALLLFADYSPPALAQGHGSRGTQGGSAPQTANEPIIASLPNWDFNHDGVFTCENWKRYLTQIFNRADRKKRGYIDAQEFEAIKAADLMFAQADFSYFDEQHKGRIARSDFVDRPSPFFLRYDKRHTCRVTRTDINAAPVEAAMPQKRGRSGIGRNGLGQGF
jgi:hypothetical protein